MVIKVDVSRLSISVKQVILNTFEYKSILEKQSDINKNIVILNDENDVLKVKQILEDSLRTNRIIDYIVAENIKEENEIAILKKGDIEQLGIFVCAHCGMIFESELQRTIHQQIHYFF